MTKIAEIWKPIPKFEKLYEISNLGKVRSLPREIPIVLNGVWYINKYRGGLLKETLNKYGHTAVYIGSGKSRIAKAVYQIITEVFSPNPNNYSIINHIDGNKQNNNSVNIEWISFDKANEVFSNKSKQDGFVPIKEYEGLYEINKFGDVKSLERYTSHPMWGYHRVSEKILKSKIEKTGYRTVGLCKNGITKYLKIHRLLAITFIPNPNNKETVNHINGIKLDNRIENLEWLTGVENTHHAYKNGLVNNTGINNGRAKLSESDVEEIYKSKISNNILSKKYGVSSTIIGYIKKCEIWKSVTQKLNKNATI